MPSRWTNECEYHERFDDNWNTKPEVLHAESHAIAKVARSNESEECATLYTTHSPCLDCAKLIYQSGIKRVVWRTQYKTDGEAGNVFLVTAGIEVDYLP